jgi:hypothetical protein
MDRRDAAGGGMFKWYERLDEDRMIATVAITTYGEDEHGEETEEEGEQEIAIRWEVCGTCDGRGTHVNPSIDAHGICEDEWSEWGEDERESYLSGRYDVTCYECGGRRVVPVQDENRNPPEVLAQLAEAEEDRAAYAAECESERRWGA